MPGQADVALGNILIAELLSTVLSPSSVAANTTAEQTFTVTGLLPGDLVFINKPTSQAGLGISGQRVSAADTMAITFINATASPIVPTASERYELLILRPTYRPRPSALV